MENKVFRIPEDGFHVFTIYSAGDTNVSRAEPSTTRRPKRRRAISRTSSMDSVNIMTQQNTEEEEQWGNGQWAQNSFHQQAMMHHQQNQQFEHVGRHEMGAQWGMLQPGHEMGAQ
ncbi:hypothetical protein MKW94_002221 [Papaver nudicaule]|uniref:Uncharacterized protein n=1 Tax=Papaver nudicaule TaxID=74823 RepID=A0AA41SE33_PAPNU|nr:hypothetical protein [Papaver nudicaule]